MKILTSNKAIISLLGVSSIVLAGSIKDFHTHTVKISENGATDKEEMLPVERNVASEAASKVAQMYLPMNAENIVKINASWEITRIVGSDEKVAFDKFANIEDAKKSIKIKWNLLVTVLSELTMTMNKFTAYRFFLNLEQLPFLRKWEMVLKFLKLKN